MNLPSHLQAIIEKHNKVMMVSITDVTPAWMFEAESAPTQRTTEHQKAINNLQELKTILKGQMGGDKRQALEKSLVLAQLRVREFEKYAK